MLEIHGWITVRETYEAIWEEEDNICSVVEQLQDYINLLKWFKPPIKAMDGAFYIEFTLFSNRKNTEYEEMKLLLKEITLVAKGSYGLIYINDSEGKNNIFQVYVLARGELKERQDIFLSPLIPTVEDEWTDGKS